MGMKHTIFASLMIKQEMTVIAHESLHIFQQRDVLGSGMCPGKIESGAKAIKHGF